MRNLRKSRISVGAVEPFDPVRLTCITQVQLVTEGKSENSALSLILDGMDQAPVYSGASGSAVSGPERDQLLEVPGARAPFIPEAAGGPFELFRASRGLWLQFIYYRHVSSSLAHELGHLVQGLNTSTPDLDLGIAQAHALTRDLGVARALARLEAADVATDLLRAIERAIESRLIRALSHIRNIDHALGRVSAIAHTQGLGSTLFTLRRHLRLLASDIERCAEVLSCEPAERAPRCSGYQKEAARRRTHRLNPAGQRILELATNRLPAEHRQRYAEEWAAELAELPPLQRIIPALGLLARSGAMRAGLTSTPSDAIHRQAPWERR